MSINVSVEEGSGDVVSVEVNTGFVAHTHTFSDLIGLGENIEDVIGFMISNNIESGISVTYNDELGKLDFDVNDPLITFTGDVTGSGTITNLSDTSFELTVTDNSHNHLSSNVTDFTESTQDVVGGMITGNTANGISVTYDDENGKLNFDVADPIISISGDATGSATMTNLGSTDIEIDLSNTGVTAGTYGAEDTVSQFTVDEDGRVTFAQDTTIDILSTQVSDFTEASQDSAAPLFTHSDHTNITVTYDDENNKIVLVGSGNVLSVNGDTGDVVLDTDDVDEGATNQYFTDDRAKDSAGNLISNATLTGLSSTYDSGTNSLSISNTGVLDITSPENQLYVEPDAFGVFEISFGNEVLIPQNLTVNGNFTVMGGVTSIETAELNVEDNNITLNAGLTSIDSPISEGSGIYVNRGSQPEVFILWDEASNEWIVSDGTETNTLGAVQSVNDFTGEVSLTTNEITENVNQYFTIDRALDTVLDFVRDSGSNPDITVDYSGPIDLDPRYIDISINSSPRIVISGRNNTAQTIPAGKLVYITGYTAGQEVPNVDIADYNSTTTIPAVGITEGEFVIGAVGRIVVQGYAVATTRAFDSVSETFEDLYQVGEILYAGVNGEFVTYDQLPFDKAKQKIGIVTRLETELVEGQIFIFNSGNEEDRPILEQNYFLLGTQTGSIPTLFSMENLVVEGQSTLPAANTVQLGQMAFLNTNNKMYYNDGVDFQELSILGHNHISSDITDLRDETFSLIDDFLDLQLDLSGLDYVYDPETQTGTLSVSDPDITISVSGDLTGTATGQLNDLTNFTLDVPVAYDRFLFAQYIYDSFDHIRHANITASFDADPQDAEFPQIILDAPTPYTQEEIQDFVAPLLTHSNHTNVTVVYDDLPNEILLSVPDSVDTIQFGTRTAVNGNVNIGLLDIASALGYTPIANNDAETVTDLIAPAFVHDNNVNIIATYDDDNDRIVLEAQNAGAASVGSLTNSWWLGA
jgi:hypothetical protein